MANQTATFNEDKVACLLGGLLFVLGLAKFAGLDLVGWIVKMGMWVDNPLDCFKAASKGMVTDVIEPAQTRSVLAMAFRATLSKRQTRPAKKHGNIAM